MGFVDTVMAGGIVPPTWRRLLSELLSGFRRSLWSRTAAGINAGYRAIKWFRRRERIAHQVRQGFWLAGFVPFSLCWYCGMRVTLSVPCKTRSGSGGQSRGLSACVAMGRAGYLFFQVARNQCEGLAKTKRVW